MGDIGALEDDWYTHGIFLTPLDQIMNITLSESGENVRNSRNGKWLVLLVAVVTQVVLLTGVASIMGVAVTAMCTILGEIMVLTAVASALERQIITFSDLATILEVCATVAVTVLTIFLGSVGSGSKPSEGNIMASKFI